MPMIERQHRTAILDRILNEDRDRSRLAERKRPARPLLNGSTSAPIPSGTDLQECRSRADRARKHGDFETAAQELDKAVRLANHTGSSNPAELIRLHLHLGSVLQQHGDCDAAEESFRKAEDLINGGFGPSLALERVDLDSHRALLAIAQGDPVTAERHLIDAINAYENDCEPEAARLTRLYLDLGTVYTEAEHFDKAMEIVLEGLAYLEESSDESPLEKMRMFQLLASIAFKKGELEATVRHLLEAYRFAQQIDSQQGMVELEATLATVYTQHAHYETAAQWYETAIRRQQATNASARWPVSLLTANLAQVQAQFDEPQATQTFTESVDLMLSYLVVNPCGE